MKRTFVLLLLMGSMTLTGCMEKNTMSDAELNIVAEHVALSILNRQNNYTPMYHTTTIPAVDSETIETPTPTKEPDDSNDKKVNETTQTPEANTKNEDSSIEEILNLKNFAVTYKGYDLYDTYPDDETMAYFSLTPSSIDNKFLVITFTAKNKSKKEQTLNLKDVKVAYRLDIDTGSMYKPLLTLMPNDMQYVVCEVKGKDDTDLILVFEVSKDINLDKLNLLMSREDQARIIKLK